MKKILAPRLAALAAALFDKPPTHAYSLACMFILMVGASVAYGDNHLPTVVKHLVMILSLVGVARMFSSPALRVAWVSIVGFISFAVVLDVAVMFV
jgi:hypothetical protein